MSGIARLKTSGGGSVSLEAESTAQDVNLRLPAQAGDLYGQGNIVGTVSQTDGVPTGAIIESGENANGRYVKFADGTLVMSSRPSITQLQNPISTGQSGGGAVSIQDFDLPAFSFTDVYGVANGWLTTSGGSILGGEQINITVEGGEGDVLQLQIIGRNLSSQATELRRTWFIVSGRWFEEVA